jgi:O-antigen ligase
MFTCRQLLSKKNLPAMIKLLFLGGILVSPFIFWPSYRLPYEIPRVIFIIFWIELLGIIGFLGSLIKPPNLIYNHLLPVLIISMFFIAVITAFTGVNLTQSIWGNYFRLDGLYTLTHLVGLYFIVCLYWKNSWRILTSLMITVGATGLSIWTIIVFGINEFKPGYDLWNPIPVGISFGQPNFLAGYLLLTLPFILYLQKNYRQSYIKISCVILEMSVTLAIFITQSVASSLLICLWWLGIIIIKGKKSLLIYGSISAILVISVSGIFFLNQRQKKFSWDYQPESRTRIMIKTLLGATTRPILGWGWANVDAAFAKIPYPFPVETDLYVDKAHSQILEIFTTSGILGLSTYLSIIVYLLFTLIQQFKANNFSDWHIALFTVLLIYLLHSQTNVTSIAEEIWFWIVAGIATASQT